MDNNILYSDNFLEIKEGSILVRDYYYPFGNKSVQFENVDSVVVKKPSIFNGRFRYYGTGDFRTWFPPDNRTARDAIFVIKIKKKWWRIGLTVEDSKKVFDLFKSKCTVIDERVSPVS